MKEVLGLVPLDGSSSSQYGVNHVVSGFKKNPRLQIHVLNVQTPFSKHLSRHTSKRTRSEFQLEKSGKAFGATRRTPNRANVSHPVLNKVGVKAAR